MAPKHLGSYPLFCKHQVLVSSFNISQNTCCSWLTGLPSTAKYCTDFHSINKTKVQDLCCLQWDMDALGVLLHLHSCYAGHHPLHVVTDVKGECCKAGALVLDQSTSSGVVQVSTLSGRAAVAHGTIAISDLWQVDIKNTLYSTKEFLSCICTDACIML